MGGIADSLWQRTLLIAFNKRLITCRWGTHSEKATGRSLLLTTAIGDQNRSYFATWIMSRRSYGSLVTGALQGAQTRWANTVRNSYFLCKFFSGIIPTQTPGNIVKFQNVRNPSSLPLELQTLQSTLLHFPLRNPMSICSPENLVSAFGANSTESVVAWFCNMPLYSIRWDQTSNGVGWVCSGSCELFKDTPGRLTNGNITLKLLANDQ
jgi:hypothetical protein